VDPARPLAQLVPVTSRLVAKLYVPSRAAGFTRAGDTVLLRYDAFPYQKFGQHAGTVQAVSTAAVAPSELQGAGPRLDAAGMPGEPLFAISVALPAQTIAERELQAGMRLEADLLHETRRLYEWILEPLYAARQRSSAAASP
jgi:membrane fusion protein